MAKSRAVAASRLEDADTVLVLRSTWSHARMGKSFRLGPDGRAAKPENYRLGTLFVPEVCKVGSIRDLHELWARLARAGDAFCVRGALSGRTVPAGTSVGKAGRHVLEHEHVTRRHGTDYHDGHPPGLVDAERRWVFLDLDKIPNVLGLDPRHDPDSTLRFLTGLLPPAVRDTTASWDWSSSMCAGLAPGQPPEHLSVHLRLWLDVALGSVALRTLLERLRDYVWLRLAELGISRGGTGSDNVVDPKVAEPQQPLYLAAPRFEGGMPDPFPGNARLGLLEESQDVLNLSELERQLEAAGVVAPHRMKEGKPARSKSAAARPRPKAPRQPLPEMPPETAEVVPFSAAGRLDVMRRDWRAHSLGDRIAIDRALFCSRAPLELVRLVRGRAELGATDGRWADWHQARGVPEGQRDEVLFLVGCLIAESMADAAALEHSELTEDRVHQAVLEVGRLIVDLEWLREEWVRGRYGRSLVANAVAAARGETEVWREQIKDTRYFVGKARLLRELRVLPEEVARYGLRSLASDADRLAAERLGKGATPRSETQDRNTRNTKAAQRLMAEGMSLRKAAEMVGMDPSQLSRLLKSKAASDKAARQDEACSADVPNGSVDSSSAGREEGKEERGRKPDLSSPYTESSVPVLPAPADPWAAVAEQYRAIEVAAGRRGADGGVAVPRPEADAPEEVQEAYRAALEGVADARRRTERLHRRRHGPAQAVRAWYDALSELPVPEAVARVKARRRELFQVQQGEMAVALAAGAREGASRTLSLRHVGAWAVENRHAARVLGDAWTTRRRPENMLGVTILRGPEHSAEWRHAVRTAQGLVLLTVEERRVVLEARAAEADGEADRDDVRLLRRAVQVALAA